MNISADDLILFAQVVQNGSFSATALKFNAPKSTLSRRITQLENDLGERLLTRTTRQLVLTGFGQKIYEHAQRLAIERHNISTYAQDRKAEPEGILRISLPAGLIEMNLAHILHEYCTRYPKVQLDLDLSPRRVDLIAERFDIAVRSAHELPDDNTLIVTKIYDLHYQLYASPEYIQERGMPKHPEELSNHAGLKLSNHYGEIQAWQLARGNEHWQVTPAGMVSSNSPNLHRELAVKGMGIVALPRQIIQTELTQGTLLPVLDDWQLPTVTLWALMPSRRLIPARSQLFIEIMRAYWRGG